MHPPVRELLYDKQNRVSRSICSNRTTTWMPLPRKAGIFQTASHGLFFQTLSSIIPLPLTSWVKAMLYLNWRNSFQLFYHLFVILILYSCPALSFTAPDSILPAEPYTNSNEMTDPVVSLNSFKVNVAGEFCLGIYIQSGLVLTSEACLKSSLISFRLNHTDFIKTQSGQFLTVYSEKDFKINQKLGLILISEQLKTRDIALLPKSTPVSSGSTVTIYSYLNSKDGDIQIESFSSTVNSCSQETASCYIESQNLISGSPVFFGNSLLCIGSGIPGECIRPGLAGRHLGKRSANPAPDNCQIIHEGDCTVLTCDKNSDFSSQCYGHQNSTVKNGHCDGHHSVQEIICNSGARCVLNVEFSGGSFIPDKCNGGYCTKGACGQHCTEDCTVESSQLYFSCSYSCDEPSPSPDPEASKRVTWFVLGGVAGPIFLGFAAIVGYIMWHHYKHPNGDRSMNRPLIPTTH